VSAARHSFVCRCRCHCCCRVAQATKAARRPTPNVGVAEAAAASGSKKAPRRHPKARLARRASRSGSSAARSQAQALADAGFVADDDEVMAEAAQAAAASAAAAAASAAAAAAAAAIPPPLTADASRYEPGQGDYRRSLDRARAARLPVTDDRGDDSAGEAGAAAVTAASVISAAEAGAARKRKAVSAAGGAGISKAARGSSAGGAAASAADAASVAHDDPSEDEVPGVRVVDSRVASQPSRFYHLVESGSAASSASASAAPRHCVLQFSARPCRETWYCDLCDAEGGPGYVGPHYSCKCTAREPVELCLACAVWRRDVGDYCVDLTAAEAKQYAVDPQGRPTLPASEYAKYVCTARRATLCQESWDSEVLVIVRFLVVVSPHTHTFRWFCLSLLSFWRLAGWFLVCRCGAASLPLVPDPIPLFWGKPIGQSNLAIGGPTGLQLFGVKKL